MREAKQVLHSLLAVLFIPNDFAQEELTTREVSLFAPSLIVSLSALLNILGFLLAQEPLTSAIVNHSYYLSEADLDLLRTLDNLMYINYFTTILGGLAIVPFWIIGAGFVSAWGVLMGGQDEFKRTLALYGYAHTPILLHGLLTILIMLFYPPKIEFDIQSYTPNQFVNHVLAFRDDYLYSYQLVAIRSTNYAAQVWSAFSLVLGASALQRISYLAGILGGCLYLSLLWGGGLLIYRILGL
jgi:hypothetical protein